MTHCEISGARLDTTPSREALVHLREAERLLTADGDVSNASRAMSVRVLLERRLRETGA